MSGQSVERRVAVNSEGGLHFRVASLFVSCAERFSSEICVVKGEQKVNGKSIMELMTLAAEMGQTLVLKVKGSDAEMAMAALVEVIENK